jgi:hypothetical protein
MAPQSIGWGPQPAACEGWNCGQLATSLPTLDVGPPIGNGRHATAATTTTSATPTSATDERRGATFRPLVLIRMVPPITRAAHQRADGTLPRGRSLGPDADGLARQPLAPKDPPAIAPGVAPAIEVVVIVGAPVVVVTAGAGLSIRMGVHTVRSLGRAWSPLKSYRTVHQQSVSHE